MIKIADNDFNVESHINALAVGNPFGCRIKSLYNTYDYNLPFVDFWAQLIDGNPTALIARLETAFILQITDYADIDELSAFMRVSGAASIIADGKYKLCIGLDKITGPILKSSVVMENERSFTVNEPTVKEVYSVISKCASKNFAVPSFESFALDVSHRLSKNTLRIYGIKEKLTFISCIMTLAESDDSAVLGALATDPDYRNSGFGTFLIKYINNVLVNEGKSVFLHRAPDENIDFYNKLGFEHFGTWAEYS
ncbi:MAG: GNAT family N-acetyltransferase [Ruminococcus sp.]|nr:GNAT family N-acetyltransferase [Ruminococcus sp.]